ncbi:MAG TPA: GNAT family N-acetyltransferase [Pseudonocardiaceae bacterium]|jgi:GNAT superfamily N-acetyltransferase|nr:GNAT family N-acetyltransferase [Pseudonocardiaceae bacterium]
MADVVIRPYRPQDRDQVYDVCLRTSDSGRDGTALYRDPELIGDLFAGPYLLLAPDFAFVLDDGERVSGYVLGVPDTPTFYRQLREVWLPLVGERHPAPVEPPANRDEEMSDLLHHPERLLVPAIADYPAHLHIDLLPHVQRAGWGRKLIKTLLDALHKAGVPRVYLGMLTTNTAAGVFYECLGFHLLDVPDPGPITFYGRGTEC